MDGPISPRQGTQRSEFRDNEFDFSAFEFEVTRRHPGGDFQQDSSERKAQDERERDLGSVSACRWQLEPRCCALVVQEDSVHCNRARPEPRFQSKGKRIR